MAEGVELVRGIAQGLAYAHRKNLVHRDIKPGNILLAREGEEVIPKIVDFGLARMGGGERVIVERVRDGDAVLHGAGAAAGCEERQSHGGHLCVGEGAVRAGEWGGTGQCGSGEDSGGGGLAETILKCIKTNTGGAVFQCGGVDSGVG